MSFPRLHRTLVAGIALGLAGLSSPSRAAPSPRPAPAADAVPAEPGATSASYGDWVYRCQRLAGEGGRVCEVAQTIQAQGQGAPAAPVAQIAVGRLPGQASLHVTLLLPPNVSFPSAVRVSDGKDGGPDLDLPWRRCLPGACIADADVTEAVLAGWRKAAEPGRITFKDGEGREIAVSLSFRGLAPALDALAREKS